MKTDQGVFLCRTCPWRDMESLTVHYTTPTELRFQFSIIRYNGMQCPTYTLHSLDSPAVTSYYFKLKENTVFQRIIGGRRNWPIMCMEFQFVTRTFLCNPHNRTHGVITATTTTWIFALKANIPYHCRNRAYSNSSSVDLPNYQGSTNYTYEIQSNPVITTPVYATLRL
jgi:hypothetical protein